MRWKIYFSEVWASLQDPYFYQRLFMVGEGTGFAYLAKLVAIGWLLVSIVYAGLIMNARSQVEEEGMDFLAPAMILKKLSPQFPPVIIEKGRTKVEVEQPVMLKDPDSGGILMVIDTTDKISRVQDTQAVLLLNSRALQVKYDDQVVSYNIPEELNITITGDTLEDWSEMIEKYLPYAPFITMPVNILTSLLFFGGRMLLFGGIVYLSLKPRLESVTVTQALRLSAYALTASVLLKMLMLIVGVQPFAYPDFIFMALGILYLMFATVSVTRIMPPVVK